jgi:putative two-component system response regulator
MNTEKPLILIVDDNPTNIDLLLATLKDTYRFGVCKQGKSALEYVEKIKPNLILLDVMMPGMDGFEVCTVLKRNPETAMIPVIFITAMQDTASKTKGLELGAVDYITKPFHAAEVLARVQTHVQLDQMKKQLMDQNTLLEQKVQEKTAELKALLNCSISSMAQVVEIRDPYTAGHQHKVARLACLIGKKLGLSDFVIEGLRIAGLLHDVGKIRIPVSILSRAGKLLDAEHDVIKIHPQVGFEILKNIPFPWPIAQIVYQHHERLDGSGYPLGIKGDAILLEAKIISVADVTEAQSSFRPYRPALGWEVAMAELREHRCTRYDAAIVDACLELISDPDFSFEEDMDHGCDCLSSSTKDFLS